MSAATYRYIRGSRMARSATVPTERPSNDATGESAARPHLQLDLLEALRRREAGQGLVMEHADTDYRERLAASIKALAASGEGFCSDDLRREAGDPPCDHHLIGAVMQGAIKGGLIKQVSTTRSGRLIGHGNKVGVYVGVSVNWP
jgi:hypothetical protein